MENIEITETGLKCDNPECDWKDESITYTNYKEWLNKPCPKCGQNVLTQEDYDNAEVLLNSVNLINSLNPEQPANLSEEQILSLFSEIGLDATGLDFNKPTIITVSTHKEVKAIAIRNEE